jgi:15-cis-phytoene synthase
VRLETRIFKNGSTTYYFSSKFFPRKVREDVADLYSFVRTADDYVDKKPAQTQKLLKLEQYYQESIKVKSFDFRVKKNDSVDQRVVKNIIRVSRKYGFENEWVESFIASMKQDISPKTYETLSDSLDYVYGSADVIGLMMAKIMELPDESLKYAQMQGRAMQWINFARDVKEDNGLGRCYFPATEIKKFGIDSLDEQTALKNPDQFKKFIRFQIKRYYGWQTEANKGFKFIPRRLRIPLQTAVDMYAWTAEQIEKDPFIVFEKKVKPRKRDILRRGAYLRRKQ